MWSTSFLLYQCLMFCILSNVGVYRLYHVLLRIHYIQYYIYRCLKHSQLLPLQFLLIKYQPKDFTMTLCF
jgi:hypothetical protein